VLFVERQKGLIDRLYQGERPEELSPEERVLATLISHDKRVQSGLESFVRNMLAIMNFDVYRRGRFISQQELAWYSDCLARSVTDGLQYFIGNGYPYPDCEDRCLAAKAAHITHLLRDMLADTANGFINIPREYLEAHHIGPDDVDSPAVRAWVRERVKQARQYFRQGKHYLDRLNVLRCKIAGYWYCARFEGVLATIESDGYRLRAAYNERRKRSAWIRIALLALSVSLQHLSKAGASVADRDRSLGDTTDP